MAYIIRPRAPQDKAAGAGKEVTTRKNSPASCKDSTLSEAGVIEAIAQRFAYRDPRVLVGLGDDAAVVRLGELAGSAKRLNAANLVYTTDLLIETVHFSLRYMSLADVGYKALAVNLSDIAAMGAAPCFALGNLGIPYGARGSQVRELLDGVAQAAQLCGVELIGGDTVAAPQWVVGFMVVGEVPGPPLLRRGARPGDIVWHTGGLGLSQTGLHLLWGGVADAPEALRLAHARPAPQLAFAQSLQRGGLATAALDLSDSLAQCALLLAQASGVGLLLDFTSYAVNPLVRGFTELHSSVARAGAVRITIPAKLNPGGKRLVFASLADYVLASAEDYQLLFTSAPEATAAVFKTAAGCGVTVTRLGRVVDAAESVGYYDELGRHRELLPVGFEHLSAR
jgi:thiamine-monophosphate kinase